MITPSLRTMPLRADGQNFFAPLPGGERDRDEGLNPR
jgi:hypothetical protein